MGFSTPAISFRVSSSRSSLPGAGDENRFDQADELVAGRRAEHPHPRVFAAAEKHDGRRLIDAVLRAIVEIENEVLLVDGDLVVQPRNLVQHLFCDRPALGSTNGLREEQQRDRLFDRGEVFSEDFLVLRRQETHHPIIRAGGHLNRLDAPGLRT